MTELLLELLVESLAHVADILELTGRWRFFLCLLTGAGLAMLINSTVRHPKVSLALVICVGFTALVSGLGWQISSGKS